MANKMRPIHPGEQLQDELDEMGMSGAAFAAAIHVPANRITEILRQKRVSLLIPHYDWRATSAPPPITG
jgi:plasmid maintenance system antidote protein VapI